MRGNDSDEFYIGYERQTPGVVARRVRLILLCMLFVTVAVAIAVVVGQSRLPASFFEYGKEREFEGVILERPVPMLLVERPGSVAGLPKHSRYALVGLGKHGVEERVRGLDGRRIRLLGSRIYRDGLMMIEIREDSIEIIPAEREKDIGSKRDWLGVQTLAGEIVDSKCYLGVMNPGNRTTHRECAIRCLSGGIPALFVVENLKGEKAALWLVSLDDTAVGPQVLDLVARPVEITGEVTREGDQLFLRADPRTFHLVGSP